MELNTEKLNVKIDGVGYELTYPTVSTIRKFERKGDKVGIDEICDFLIDSGLPGETVNLLQANHLNQIVQALMGKLKA